jgi:superoxide dismutase, Cu-Zn family
VLRGDSKVSGIVTFEQSTEHSPTTITYDISGNDPNAERGMHVHQFGDNTNGCTSAGPHCMCISGISDKHGAWADTTWPEITCSVDS